MPWRFRTAGYRAASPAGRPLEGRTVTASWDSELAGAMSTAGVAVEEKHVLDDLLDDLAMR